MKKDTSLPDLFEGGTEERENFVRRKKMEGLKWNHYPKNVMVGDKIYYLQGDGTTLEVYDTVSGEVTTIDDAYVADVVAMMKERHSML